MALISQEEENYVRMVLLLTRVSPRAVRVLFDKEFPPPSLSTTINSISTKQKLQNLNTNRIINNAQWDLLFPSSGNTDSKTFDLTLMVAMLRNLTSIGRPVNGFDQRPPANETTAASDLARIKYDRNELAHHSEGKIDNNSFITAWNNISEAVKRLGGQPMKQECDELLTKPFQSDPKIQHELEKVRQENVELRSGHQSLQKAIELIKGDTVPWNRRESINEELKEWKKNTDNIVETKASKNILKRIQEKSCVTIIASSGVGKTTILQQVALQMESAGYDILPITDPKEIVDFSNPNKKTLFVFDNLCGRFSINRTNLESWIQNMEQIEKIIEKKLTKIIVACRLLVYKDTTLESLSIFKKCVCNLLSKDFCLSKAEKLSIAEFYLKTKASEIIQYCDLYECFPLLCKLYSENPKLNIKVFFQNPFSVYEKEIDKLYENKNYDKYCALALCVMFNNELKEEWLTDVEIDPEIKRRIKNTFEACRLNRGTSRSVIQDALVRLKHTFIKKENGVFKTIHDKIFDFLSFYFGKNMIQFCIENGDSAVINQRFLLVDKDNAIIYQRCLLVGEDSVVIDPRFLSEGEDGMTQFISGVPPKYHQIYEKRMIKDWSKGRLQDVYNNINMNNPEFRKRFLCYLKTMDISCQDQLALICDVDNRDTVLIQCCQYDDMPWINWCIDHGVDVNKCNCDGVSPLIKAAEYGHTRVVKLLLKKGADINKSRNNRKIPKKGDLEDFFMDCLEKVGDCLKKKISNKPLSKTDIKKCDDDGASALYMACKNNHIGTVKLLLDNKADINKFAESGSPFYIACKYNHKEIVMILIESNVEINKKCTDGGATPLYIACENNCIDTVKILLDYQADINKCGNFETSPLYIACQNNHIMIVRILLDKNADWSKCSLDGYSPLFAASQNNNKEIVKVLLDNGADVDMCRDDGSSPLNAACCNNYTETVEILLNYNADINKCNKNGASPLHIACSYNHSKTVKLLLNNKADINKSDNNGESSLYIACKLNHIETVQVLLDNKADINKLKDNEATPLYIACQNNNKEIVKVLLDNGADVDMCIDDGLSPLNAACCNNYTETVEILLNYNADISKCNKNGASPLYIACFYNHSKTVKLLLNNKADINKSDNNGESSLYIACKLNHIETVQVLLDNKADINKFKDNEATPLYIACQNNNKEIVKLLLDKNSDMNKCANNGASPLYIACQKNHKEIVELLLDNTADVNVCLLNGMSPLYIACKNKHIEIVKILLDNKADVNKYKDNGASPLYIACQNNNKEIVKLLLDKQPHINKCANNGASPLYIACKKNHREIVELLLDNTADVNMCLLNGMSPLYIASKNNHIEIVKVLLDNKADINKCIDNGASPLKIARSYNNIEVVKLLQNYKADID